MKVSEEQNAHRHELKSGFKPPHSKFDWPHAPVHRLDSRGVFMITAATLHKQPLFSSSRKLDLLHRNLIELDRKSTRLNSSHVEISYAVFCLKKKKKKN